MPKDLLFYTNPQSRGRIVRWMLEEIGVPYETHMLDYATTMKSADYLAINPMGKVPALRHGETLVTETVAICAYLADAFPEAGLAPAPAERGAYYRWLFYAAGPLDSAFTFHALEIAPEGKQRGMVGFGDLERVTRTLEQVLGESDYVAGPAFTAADLVLGGYVTWCLYLKVLEERPALVAYSERVRARPAYKRAAALDDEATAKLQGDA